jgi:hypothetical protein
MTAARLWWPRRRAEPSTDEAMGNEAGCLPYSFEPEETLGDTYPAPLDETASQHLVREARVNRWIYALVAAVALLAYFGLIA